MTPKVGEFLAETGFLDGWVPIADLGPDLATRIVEVFRRDGPKGFRDCDDLTCRSLAFAPRALLVCVIPPGSRMGFGLYGFWTGHAWHTLDRRTTRKEQAFRELHPTVVNPLAAPDLVVFCGLFQHWDKSPTRVLIRPKDLAVTRAPTGTGGQGDEPLRYESLSSEELAAVCARRSIQRSGAE